MSTFPDSRISCTSDMLYAHVTANLYNEKASLGRKWNDKHGVVF